MSKKFLKQQLGLFLILIFFAISGCQTFSFAPPEQVLENRVNEMMNARVAQNWSKVYDYLDLANNKQMSKESFAGINRDVSFSNFAVASIEMNTSGHEAEVVVKSDMILMGFEVKGRREVQNWINTGGKWYLQTKNDFPTK